MTLADFIEELRIVRHRRHERQQDVAARIGSKQSRFCQWEKGKARPPTDMLHRWAAALGVDVPDGLTGFDPAVAQCGTDSGYAAHIRRRQATCEPCRKAHNRALTDWRSRR